MVPKEDVTNAIALNGTMFNTSTIMGPAIAGLLYALVGPGWCFTINGISFLAIIAGLLMMRVAPLARRMQMGSVMEELKEGVKYVAHHPVLMAIIWLMGAMGLFGVAFTTLLPAWAVVFLKGDATTNGLLQAARGLGALLMALWVASLGHFTFKGKLVTIGSLMLPLTIIVFALMPSVPLALLILLFGGMANLLIYNVSTSLAQLNTEDKLRGRVMGVFTLVSFGTMPLGALWVGASADWISEQATVVICGAGMLMCALGIWWLYPQLRAAE
jgi:predicted MFS family arabinose efflux permease